MDPLVRAVEEAVGGDAPRSELAFAKINLALHVLGRRTDGYHQIETLVVFADYADVVSAAPSEDGRMHLSVRGPFAGNLTEGTPPGQNLAIRAAAELLRVAGKRPPQPARLTLTKRIPIAAGLGGGSADAAATMRLLDREWGLGLTEPELNRIGVHLGADVVMCLASRPLVARGIGEQLTPVTGIPPLPIVIAHPGVAVATRDVFAALPAGDRTPLPSLPTKFASLLEVIFWLRQARNDLAEPAVAVNKAAGSAVRALKRDPDCLFARMSGSGAAAFGIFVTLEAAERAADRLRQARPGWFVTAAMTRGA
ncbi:MAG TPA: 4-(cytidine 5'-diphospho)-2-C-methyl-D-erythritol kinase [Bauldia sp.]|nr:4-(cytidine 5'-diphospho)-2-C-methyl-D-erythritol kinase [Bauldia sp.]